MLRTTRYVWPVLMLALLFGCGADISGISVDASGDAPLLAPNVDFELTHGALSVTMDGFPAVSGDRRHGAVIVDSACRDGDERLAIRIVELASEALITEYLITEAGDGHKDPTALRDLLTQRLNAFNDALIGEGYSHAPELEGDPRYRALIECRAPSGSTAVIADAPSVDGRGTDSSDDRRLVVEFSRFLEGATRSARRVGQLMGALHTRVTMVATWLLVRAETLDETATSDPDGGQSDPASGRSDPAAAGGLRLPGTRLHVAAGERPGDIAVWARRTLFVSRDDGETFERIGFEDTHIQLALFAADGTLFIFCGEGLFRVSLDGRVRRFAPPFEGIHTADTGGGWLAAAVFSPEAIGWSADGGESWTLHPLRDRASSATLELDEQGRLTFLSLQWGNETNDVGLMWQELYRGGPGAAPERVDWADEEQEYLATWQLGLNGRLYAYEGREDTPVSWRNGRVRPVELPRADHPENREGDENHEGDENYEGDEWYRFLNLGHNNSSVVLRHHDHLYRVDGRNASLLDTDTPTRLRSLTLDSAGRPLGILDTSLLRWSDETGWELLGEFCSPDSPCPRRRGTRVDSDSAIALQSVPLRAEPSSEVDALAELELGEVVTVHERSEFRARCLDIPCHQVAHEPLESIPGGEGSPWLRVRRSDGSEGWVHGRHLAINSTSRLFPDAGFIAGRQPAIPLMDLDGDRRPDPVWLATVDRAEALHSDWLSGLSSTVLVIGLTSIEARPWFTDIGHRELGGYGEQVIAIDALDVSGDGRPELVVETIETRPEVGYGGHWVRIFSVSSDGEVTRVFEP